MAGPSVFPNPYVSKSDVLGRVVVVLRGVNEQRALVLTEHRSRAVPTAQIHELMLTDERTAPNSTVQRVALMAFFEVTQGGVILAGDRVDIAGNVAGVVAGFDETHMPNHQNICVESDQLTDGETRGIRVGDLVRFRKA